MALTSLLPWALLLYAFGAKKNGGNGGGTTGGSTGSLPGTRTPPGKRPAVVGQWQPKATRPPGDPLLKPCADWNRDFWPTQISVKERFAELGYATPPNRPTMNAPGPDGSLGGGDDIYNVSVAMFQDHYNLMSGRSMLGPDAGGLAVDGFVGGCTLNAIETVYLNVPPGEWMDLLSVA